MQVAQCASATLFLALLSFLPALVHAHLSLASHYVGNISKYINIMVLHIPSEEQLVLKARVGVGADFLGLVF